MSLMLFFRRWVNLLVLGLLFAGGGLRAQTAAKADTFVEFVEAARLGDVPTVKRLLAAGQDVNQRDGHAYHYPALFHALHARQFGTARALIEAGADLKNLTDSKTYALLWAAQAGDAGIVRLMIQKGAQPHARWENKQYGYKARYPIEEALAWGRLEVIQELEKAGVRWLGEERGTYALSLVAASRRLEAAGYLISKGADVNGSFEGNFPLEGAAYRGDLVLMKLLLAKGAQVNAVSQGVSGLKDWDAYRRTALVSAVIGSQLDAVRLLLQSGADPKAMNNLAIKWADLLGDYEAYELLRKAGAPDPGPFAYREWLNLKPVAGLAPLEEVRKNKTLSAPLASVASASTAGSVPRLVRPTKFAIIPLGKDLDNAESLLAAKLSSLDQAAVLERSNIRAILTERTLTQNFGRAPGEVTRLGRLLGADALVVLRTYPIEGQQVIESRIVSVATGLVTSTESMVADAAKLPEWSAAVAKRCAADGGRIFTPPNEARLVAISPFTASVNTTEARELERQLGTLVALRLAQLPGVFLVEREILDRLQAEGRAEDKVLLNGSWLVSGSVEKSLNDAGASLQLVLKPGGGGAKREIKVASALAGTVKLAAEAVTQAEAILSTAPAQVWSPEAEAAAFLQQAEAFFARKMWSEAQSAAGAAQALGLRDDRVVRIQMESAANRIKFSAQYFSAAKRKTHELSGVLDLMSYRVPLLLPPEDERELAVGDYFEQANLILDCLEPVLARTEKKIGGVDYFDWVCGQAWDSATLALKVTEALSYQRDFGYERASLQARLLDMNSRALQVARERKEAKMLHTLIALGCKHMAWWVKGDNAFQSEILSVLRGAKAWPPPLSEHAVWGPAFEIGRSHMGMTSGRASQSWVRLAEVMAKAEDVRERYFGTALLAAELGRSGIEPAQTRLLKDFPSLVELDRSIPARVSAIGYKSVVDPGEGGPFECWYYQVLVYFLDTRMRLGAVVGSTSNTWEPRPGAQCILPELHNFYMTQLMRRFELIAQHGASGYFWPFSRKEDLSPTQAARLTERCSQASAMFTPLIQVYPEVKDATGALRFYASFYAPALQGKAVGPEVRLVLRNPRLAFEPELAKLSAADSERRYTSLGENYNLWGPGPTRWYIGRVGDRWVIYKFKSDGCTDILIWGPLAKSGEYLMMLEPKQAGRADLSDCYFVCPGRRYYKSGEQKMRCIYVYDRIAKNWLELFPDQPFEYVYDAKIFGDKIVYTFLYNPVIDAAGSHSSDDYEKRGDPLRGVMQYDLKSKLYTLLASNRRDSAAAPVEGLDRSCEAIVRINDDEFSLTNKEGKGLNKVFNMRAGTWRDQSSADKAAAKLMNGSPWDYCSVSGLNWQLSVDHTDNVLLCSTRTGNPPRLRIPLDMIDDGLTAKLAQYPDNLRYYLERKKQVWTDVKMTPEGAAFIVGSVYYWVPLEQLQQVIKQALESSGSAASAKPEDPKSKPATPAAPGATTATPVNSARDPSTTP